MEPQMPSRIHHCPLMKLSFTSWTRKNPGRRFERCERYKLPGGCNYWEWTDWAFTLRSVEVINNFRDANRGLVEEIERLRAENLKLKNELELKEQICAQTHVPIQNADEDEVTIGSCVNEADSSIAEMPELVDYVDPEPTNVGSLNLPGEEKSPDLYFMTVAGAFVCGFICSAVIF